MTALDSPQCMPEIIRPSNRSCALAFVSAFRKCATSTFQKQQHACLPHGSQFPASAICKQHGHLTRSTNVTACSACVACDALDSSSACLKLTTQVVRRPLAQFSPAACLPLIMPFVNASCIATSHAHRHACMTHKLGFPAGLPTVDHGLHSNPHSPLRRRPQMYGTHRCCSLANFCIFPAGPHAFC